MEEEHLEVHLPESLRGLSQKERDAIAKRGTRKIDIMLIPARKYGRGELGTMSCD